MHESFPLAEVALQLYDGFGYVSNYKYGPRGHAKVYRCVEHQLCGKFFRIQDYECADTETTIYDLEHRGVHAAEVSTRKRRGIYPAFKVEVDTAVLSEKYKTQETLLAYAPSEVLIKNRKAHLTRQLEKQTKITRFAELNE
ncbi:Multiple inositol polyphosphate phosphatase [Phytophthora megakarya]|uniref:Multiple inositol polyphosphate phosphatase n=1 Tax=Phytophthora megakarya TaxID=4795 RepID=A0A225VGD4_9STRA|nr:Multiple inositol polyphosphate phosphatase [Phytophthora megakarya]